jgi:DNA topoisomerase-1
VTKPLLVVESPTKVKTLQKYLGNDFKVAATVGHIKDLPEKEMGIDIENDFTPQYRTIPGKQKIIQKLKAAAGDSREIFLAPDPDREGEAIAWHTAEVLKKKDRRFYRVLFHELTENAIRAALAHPQELHHQKYEAQQTRRLLDRLVGYNISPLLWRKVKGGLSAGRVQSVAVKIICDRERAIQVFEPQEYWSITAQLEGDQPPPFAAKLVRHKDQKIEIPNGDLARRIVDELSSHPFVVDKVVRKTTRRNPLPPFTTSKLQQEAIRKLRFSARKTMMVAQQLYEGVELEGGEPVGLITYMRTDSTRIAQEAALEALELVREQFGGAYALDKPRFFKNTKKAQDAHEAIRPTSVRNTPDRVERFLSPDQAALYRLIWQRFVASQMAAALIDQLTLVIACGSYRLSASGSTVKFPGFMALYRSADDEADAEKDRRGEELPPLVEGARLKLHGLEPRQHFTTPPPRFSEASLVKELEENGIGRPSTYATILSTIRDKGYVDLLKGYFRPSELGFIVNDLIVESFPEVVNVEFTAQMEDTLDRIEQAEAESLEVLRNFYGPFQRKLEAAVEGMRNIKGVGFPSGLSCPQCQRPLHVKVGKNGPFIACSGYPDCHFSSDYERDDKGRIHPLLPSPDTPVDKTCPKCAQPMVLKRGRYGEFLACSAYPACKHTESLNGASANGTGTACPVKGCTGQLVERKSKRGKVFYGCSRFPDCTFAIWDRPVPRPCPLCHAAFLVEKTSKKRGTYYACLTEGCGFTEERDSDGEAEAASPENPPAAAGKP